MKKIIIISIAFIAVITGIVLYFNQMRPLVIENENGHIEFEYNKISKEIVVTQTSDVVPIWLAQDSILSNLSEMNLIIKKDMGNFESLKMTDNVVIADLARKFIYTRKNQTIRDFVKLKKYTKDAQIYNFGSTALFCTEEKSNEEPCKNIKKMYK